MQPDFERVHVLAERMMIAMEGENKADVAMAAAMVSASGRPWGVCREALGISAPAVITLVFLSIALFSAHPF